MSIVPFNGDNTYAHWKEVQARNEARVGTDVVSVFLRHDRRRFDTVAAELASGLMSISPADLFRNGDGGGSRRAVISRSAAHRDRRGRPRACLVPSRKCLVAKHNVPPLQFT